ncbi:MAG: hypothetical protein IJX53_04705 [Clostridia bacterium]|nr:hypothetical protein [Clostridia bacterium]
MTRHPLTVLARRARRLINSSRPELRIRAEGEVGIYPEKGADTPLVNLKFDQNIATPLLKAAAVVLAVVAIADLLDD